MENKNEHLFWDLIDCLPGDPPSPYDCGAIWQDGDEILCMSEDTIEVIAMLFEYVLKDSTLKVRTGYFDPEKAEKNNAFDQFTGYHYVRLE